MIVLADVISATIVFAVPLLLVAMGGMFSERSGIINIALEGIMIIGALMGCLMMRWLDAAVTAGTLGAQFAMLITTLFAGACGIVFSVLLLNLFEVIAKHQAVFQIQFGTAIAALFLLMLLGLLAGIAPAYRAMHIKPVDAMRDE